MFARPRIRSPAHAGERARRAFLVLRLRLRSRRPRGDFALLWIARMRKSGRAKLRPTTLFSERGAAAAMQEVDGILKYS
jgi:hypothetical protein